MGAKIEKKFKVTSLILKNEQRDKKQEISQLTETFAIKKSFLLHPYSFLYSSNKSGRLFLVCSNAISSRHLSILAKCPLVSTSGTFQPL